MLTLKPYAVLYKYKHSAKFERFAECENGQLKQARWGLIFMWLIGILVSPNFQITKIRNAKSHFCKNITLMLGTF